MSKTDKLRDVLGSMIGSGQVSTAKKMPKMKLKLKKKMPYGK